jgi:hypothetical protein
VAAAKAVAAEPAVAQPTTAKPAAAKRTPAKPATARRGAAKPTPTGPAGAEPPKPPKRQSLRDLDKTGNVRLLGDEDGGSALSATVRASTAAPASTTDPVTASDPVTVSDPVTAPDPVTVPDPVTAPDSVTAPDPVTVPDPVTIPDSTAAADLVSAAEPVSEPADSGAPLPNYDALSVASLRARLRNLDVTQVRRLADYERAHAARADVLAMFERRITKLEAEATLEAEAWRSIRRPMLPFPSVRCCSWSAGGSADSAGSG